MSVTVVIPTWNGRSRLERLLPALEASFLAVPGARAIVVDNGSVDGSAEFLAEYHPSVRVIRFPQNMGFATAINAGVRASQDAYVALLNDDTVPNARWLAELIDALDHRPDVFSAGAVMSYLKRPNLVNSAGIAVDRAGRASDWGAGAPLESIGTAPFEVFGVSAGAALFRRSVFEALDGFSEPFFAYLEDVDLAWRARRAGWASIVVPAAVVLHEDSATLGHRSARKLYLQSRNRWWLLVRNAEWRQLVRALPQVLGFEVGQVVIGAAETRSLAPVRGRLEAVRSLRRVWRERPRLPYLPPSAFERPRPLVEVLTTRLRRRRVSR